MRGKQIRGQNWEVNWAVASHPIPLPDTLQSNLQVTLVAIIKTGLLWQCVQLVLSPASDSFEVTERNKTGRRERDDGRKEELEAQANWCAPFLMKSHAKHLNSHNLEINSILEQHADLTCSDHSWKCQQKYWWSHINRTLAGYCQPLITGPAPIRA